MKKSGLIVGVVGVVLCVMVSVCLGADREQFNVTKLSLDGHLLTATAEQLNTLAAYSNATAEATYSNLVLNGTLAVAGAVTFTTPATVPSGGSGASTFTDGGILLGSGTGAFTDLGVATNGQIPIGDGASDPILATLTGTAGEIEITNGAGSITIGIPATVTGVSTLTNAALAVYGATLDLSAGLTIVEGALENSTVVSADIKDDTIVDADINTAAAIDATKIGAGTVTSAEFGYISNLTSSVQTQIDALSGAGVGGVLAPTYIIVGNASTSATAVAVSGDIALAADGTVTGAGVTTNVNVLTATGVTNVFCFTNGLLRVIN